LLLRHKAARLTAGPNEKSIRSRITYSFFEIFVPLFKKISLLSFSVAFLLKVEMRGFEPLTSAVQGRRSPN
jgi:hypothetical protein